MADKDTVKKIACSTNSEIYYWCLLIIPRHSSFRILFTPSDRLMCDD